MEEQDCGVWKVLTKRCLQAMAFAAISVALGKWMTCSSSIGWRSLKIPTYVEQEGLVDGSGSDAFLTEPWNKLTAHKIGPKKALVYSPCFNGFHCARLGVPMDWNSTDIGGYRVNLAIAKLPAKVPITDPRYGGLLWLQTGGPGSSGINLVLNHGKTVQMIVDSELDPLDAHYDLRSPPKYYDILGMDSRGVNNTTPRFSCFPTIASRDIWTLQSDAQGLIGTSNNSFQNIWARQNALAEGCSISATSGDEPEAKIASHMNTSPHIRDIVEVIEQHGEWREETARALSRPEDHRSEEARHEALLISDRTKWRKGEEPLLFWGLSYGTVVGATFAAMQPHRIKRAIIDGVVDTEDYYRGEWLKNLQDADRILDSFSEYCNTAGPGHCTFYTADGNGEIKHRFKSVVESLRDNPIGVPAHGSLAPDLITYSDLILTIRTAIYAPLQYWQTLAALLVDLENRNGTSFAVLKQKGLQLSAPSPECQNAPAYTPFCAIPPNSILEDTQRAILCSDGNSTYGMDRSAFATYTAELRDQSWLIGASWAQIRLGCVAWAIKPTWRFPGPFAGKTAHPMMIVGTVRDPVTPIRNARALAARFSGSAVAAIDAEGHTILTAPSLCMARHIRHYFQTGQLPMNGTLCEVNERAFLGITNPGGTDEQELLEKLRWSARHLFS